MADAPGDLACTESTRAGEHPCTYLVTYESRIKGKSEITSIKMPGLYSPSALCISFVFGCTAAAVVLLYICIFAVRRSIVGGSMFLHVWRFVFDKVDTTTWTPPPRPVAAEKLSEKCLNQELWETLPCGGKLLKQKKSRSSVEGENKVTFTTVYDVIRHRLTTVFFALLRNVPLKKLVN